MVWARMNSATHYQQWVAYRSSTLQLNLHHEGRQRTSECPLAAGCRRQKETTAHILWECIRAVAAWTKLLAQWTQQRFAADTEADRRKAALPYIATRKAPPPPPGFVRGVHEQYGFLGDTHMPAMERIWFVLTSSIMASLWRAHNESVHEHVAISPTEVAERAWAAAVRQVRAVCDQRVRQRETREEGIALWQSINIIENAELTHTQYEWKTTRMYFDGGARGNPGPSGSAWAIVQPNDTGNWELDACGYKYQGELQTNNYSEYEALREGLATAWRRTDSPCTHLQVRGDSNMIIRQMTGRATIAATGLTESAQRAKAICREFGWVSWQHVRREKNKMADYLANVAMDGKSRHTMETDEQGPDQARRERVRELMSNDVADDGGGWEPSTLLQAFQ